MKTNIVQGKPPQVDAETIPRLRAVLRCLFLPIGSELQSKELLKLTVAPCVAQPRPHRRKPKITVYRILQGTNVANVAIAQNPTVVCH